MSLSRARPVRRSGAAFAALAFFAFTAPLGILAHLTSEFAGLGVRDADDVLFSARHGYLLAIALAAVAAFALVLFRGGAGSARERAERIVSRLPYRGAGTRFVALSFGVQFAFFALTQIGEGCPLCSGDMWTGALAAAFASLAGAVLVAFCKRRIVEFAIALVIALSVDDGASAAVARLHAAATRTLVCARRSALYVFRNRPPPPVRV